MGGRQNDIVGDACRFCVDDHPAKPVQASVVIRPALKTYQADFRPAAIRDQRRRSVRSAEHAHQGREGQRREPGIHHAETIAQLRLQLALSGSVISGLAPGVGPPRSRLAHDFGCGGLGHLTAQLIRVRHARDGALAEGYYSL